MKDLKDMGRDIDETTRKGADKFYEAMPGTMNQPALWQEQPDRRGMLAWLLVPLAFVIAALAIMGAKRSRSDNRKYVDTGREIQE